MKNKRVFIKLLRLKKKIQHIAKKLAVITAGSIILAISYNAFVVPNKLLSGGISGLALIGKYTLGIPLYAGIALLNIPVFWLGLKKLNREFVFYSIVGLLVEIIALILTKPLIPAPQLDLFLASVFSGVLGGVGSGLILKEGASTGGTDILSMIAKKEKNISIGSSFFIFNLFVITLSLFFFDLKIALYTIVSMWVNGKVTDSVINGFNTNKSVVIISDYSSQIAERIMTELNRGVTFLKGQGAYSGDDRHVINCVASHYEIAKIKEIVYETDPKAFMFITEIVEVLGKGFTR